MRTRLFTLAFLFVLPFASALFLPSRSWAFDVFVKIDSFGDCGSATVEGFQSQIEVRGFAQDITHPTDTSGLPGKNDFRSIKMMKLPDGCTTKLFLALLQNRPLQTLTASFVQRFAEELPKIFAEIKLNEFLISSMTLQGTPGTDAGLNEVITLGIQGTLRLKVFQYDDTGVLVGTQQACWDFKRDRPC